MNDNNKTKILSLTNDETRILIDTLTSYIPRKNDEEKVEALYKRLLNLWRPTG